MDDPDRIARIVAARYACAVARIQAAPRGWTGETYLVTTARGERLFAKHIRADRLPPAALPALPVLQALHRAGVRGLAAPVPSTSGALHEDTGDGVLVLFEHIDGVQTEGGDPTGLGDLVAAVHRQPVPTGVTPLRETFVVTFGDALWATVERAARGTGDEVARGLAAFLAGIAPDVRADWAAFQAITERCRAASFDLVITHGDVPWNVMRDGGGSLHLIDWDELLLAPAERDLWFFLDQPAFMAAYRARRGGGDVDALAAAYYVHHRYFEELLAFSRTILDEPGSTRRAESLALLRGPWISGLRARIASLREE
ncbi:MAG: phosphotransferase [Dehalococcoidia bacterium]